MLFLCQKTSILLVQYTENIKSSRMCSSYIIPPDITTSVLLYSLLNLKPLSMSSYKVWLLHDYPYAIVWSTEETIICSAFNFNGNRIYMESPTAINNSVIKEETPWLLKIKPRQSKICKPIAIARKA